MHMCWLASSTRHLRLGCAGPRMVFPPWWTLVRCSLQCNVMYQSLLHISVSPLLAAAALVQIAESVGTGQRRPAQQYVSLAGEQNDEVDEMNPIIPSSTASSRFGSRPYQEQQYIAQQTNCHNTAPYSHQQPANLIQQQPRAAGNVPWEQQHLQTGDAGKVSSWPDPEKDFYFTTGRSLTAGCAVMCCAGRRS